MVTGNKIYHICFGDDKHYYFGSIAAIFDTFTPVELGLFFVDVKGCGNYYPFVVLAEAFHIPWYIFSDGEDRTKASLDKLLKKIYRDDRKLNGQPNIFLIPDKNDFERMLLADGYEAEIEDAIGQLEGENYIDDFIRNNNHTVKSRKRTSKVCEKCHQNIYEEIKLIYDGEEGRKAALDDIMAKNKAQLAQLLAEIIAQSGKPLPPLTVSLFDKIKQDIYNV